VGDRTWDPWRTERTADTLRAPAAMRALAPLSSSTGWLMRTTFSRSLSQSASAGALPPLRTLAESSEPDTPPRCAERFGEASGPGRKPSCGKATTYVTGLPTWKGVP
jgi:hypothetical protein